MAVSVSDDRPEFGEAGDVYAWTESVYSEAEQEMSAAEEFKLLGKLIDFIHGRQWNAQARFGRSRPVVNRMFRQFIEMASLITDIEPDFNVKIFGGEDSYSELARLLNDMISVWASSTDFEQELLQVVMFGMMHTGYAKVMWNPALNNGMGDNQFFPVSPINLMVVGSQNKLQDAEVVIYRTPMTIAALGRRFDKAKVARVRTESGMSGTPNTTMRPTRMSAGMWNKLTPQLRRMLGQKQEGSSTKYPIALLKEYWIKDDSINQTSSKVHIGPELAYWSYDVEPGAPLYPRGRVVATAGGVVLEDTCNPYWHARHPFAQYRPFRVPWQLNGLSPMAPVAAIQNVINRINGGVMDTVQAAIEPAIIGPKAAFSDGGWESLDPSEPGAKIKYNNNSPRAPEWRKPPELASYVMLYKQDLEKEQDATSGSAAIQQALQKKQVPGGDALDMIMNSRSTNIRLMGRSLKSFLTDVGTMVTHNNLQFSSAQARAAMFGGRGLSDFDFQPLFGRFLPQGMRPEEFVKQATFSIKKGSLLAIEKSEKLQVAFSLRKNGDISRRALYRLLDANEDLPQIEKELDEEAMKKMGQMALVAAASGKGKGHK